VSTSAPTALVAIAIEAARKHGLDPSLVCAVIEQESAWNPWAMRYEPAFFAKYVASLYTNNKVSASEAYARGFSWGLMQVMGQVAREHGFDERFLSGLCDPSTGIEFGCLVLRKKIDLAKGHTLEALLAWNGGGNPNYGVEVLARRGKYPVF
jgi:soluble lytic murein transglycosylase-like protein